MNFHINSSIYWKSSNRNSIHYSRTFHSIFFDISIVWIVSRLGFLILVSFLKMIGIIVIFRYKFFISLARPQISFNFPLTCCNRKYPQCNKFSFLSPLYIYSYLDRYMIYLLLNCSGLPFMKRWFLSSHVLFTTISMSCVISIPLTLLSLFIFFLSLNCRYWCTYI